MKAAWEECVRLREKMFWARLGGGVVPAIAREPSPTGTQRRTEARSLSRNSTESSIPRLSRNSVESVRSKVLEVPKLNEPRPLSRNNSRSTVNASDGSTTSLQTSESSDMRDFADAQSEVENTVSTPTGPPSQDEIANNQDQTQSQTTKVAQEDGSRDAVDQTIETSPSASTGQEENRSSIEQSEKENQANVMDGESEKDSEAPVDKSLQPEMPGSFD